MYNLNTYIYYIMRYIISPTQFHKLIYKYLDDINDKGSFKRKVNPFVKSGGTWSLHLYDENGDEFITYFWFEPGIGDDGNPHDGVGDILVSESLVKDLTKFLSVRKTRVFDIIADWFSEKFNVDIDDISEFSFKKGD